MGSPLKPTPPPPPAFVPLVFDRHRTAEEQVEASRAFLARIGTRRTVRDFAPDPVPPEVIENAIRAAASAPSGANQQPWRFVAVTDPARKHRIRVAAEAEEKESYERRMPQEWLDAIAPLGTDWHKPFLETAPCLIAVFRLDYSIEEPTGRKIKHYYVQESVGIACGFLLAALHLSGLATLTHTPSPMGFLAGILDRPANERPFLLIPTGYPAENAQVPDIEKKPLAEVLVKL